MNRGYLNYILLASFALWGCAPQKTAHTAVLDISEDFVPYVAEFDDYNQNLGGRAAISDLQIGYDTQSQMGPDLTGLCIYSPESTPVVLLNPSIVGGFIASNNEMAVRTVVFHELGHCVNLFAHVTTLVWQVNPVTNVLQRIAQTVMYPTRINSTTFTQFFSYYVNYLFTQSHPSFYSP